MKQMRNFKLCMIISLLCLASVFSGIFISNANSVELYAEETIVSQQGCCKRLVVEEEYCADCSFSIKENANYASGLRYRGYDKGDRTVNVLFNFVNYPNDNSNHFTYEEITNIVTEFEADTKIYFERMSQGYVDINIDYVCSTAPKSYNYYLELGDSYFTEYNIFNSAVDDCLDYYGNKKSVKFNEYNFKVNAFAGHSGSWSSFLWPHAYSSSNMILMMEYKEGSKMEVKTLCHEMSHTFGVPDLYSYTGSSTFGVGSWDMMASNTKNVQLNSYYRQEIGWIQSSSISDSRTTQIEEISPTQKGSLELKLYPSCTNDYSKTIAYKFGENEDNDEFFMVEYRYKNYQNTFDKYINETCVTIYRVNPNAPEGNTNRSESSSYVYEIIFMGNQQYDVSSGSYISSCALNSGESYGSKNSTTNTSLVYSSAGGKSNLFNGINSNIIVTVNSLTDEFATITIEFEQELYDKIDLSKTTWNYSSAFTYNGSQQMVELINVPDNVSVSYSGEKRATNVGTYVVSVSLSYDMENYQLINDNVLRELSWQIIPAKLTIKADNKTSKYGDPLQTLTYSVMSGQIYNNDNLNVQLNKEYGYNKGFYDITISAQNDNYQITLQNGEYVITHRTVAVKVFDQKLRSVTHEQLDQTKYEVLSTQDSVIEGDDLQIRIVIKNQQSKDSYIINAVSYNENYELTVEMGLLTIEKSKIDLANVKWNYIGYMIYDGYYYSVNLLNVPQGAKVTYSGRYFEKNAGSYIANVNVEPENDCYELINVNFVRSINWEIARAEITIKADNKISSYGDELEQLTYEITSGTVYNDDNLNVSLRKQNGLNKGDYEIYCDANNSNYNITTIDGKYTIIPRIVEVELLHQEFTNQENNTIDQSKYQILDENQVIEGDELNVVIKGVNSDFSKAGEYKLTAVSGNQNYRLKVISNSVTVRPAGVIKTENSQSNLTIIIIISAVSVVAIAGVIIAIIIKKKKA